MKYAQVLQHTEEDCGAACLASIAKYYGRIFTLNQTREVVGTGQSGTSLLGLKQGAETLGFHARTVKTSPEILNRMHEAPLPAIIHWQGCHWVVLYGKNGRKCVILDPAVGIRYISQKELAEGWEDWITLLLEPDPVKFYSQPNAKISGLGRFLKHAWGYRGTISQAFILNAILGLLSLSSPFLLQILTDDVLVRGDTKLLTTVALSVMAMTLISSVLELIQSSLIANFAQRLELGLILEFGRQILRLPLAYYESRRSGEITSRLQDVQEINSLISQVVVSLPSQFFIAIISFAFMTFYSWKLTVMAVIVAIFMTVSTVIFLPALQKKTRDVLVTEAENQGVLVETFKGALTLKTTTSAPQFWNEFQNRFSRFGKLSLDTIQIGIINGAFASFISAIGGIALLWFGGNLVTNSAENLSIGQLLAFKSMNDNFLGLISTLIKFVDEFTRVKTATQRLGEVIDATPEDVGDENKPTARLSCDSEIEFSQVNFHYPGRTELLSEFSLTIPGGEVIALIGKSGCGKSTFAKLLTGLYQPQSGNIRIGLYNLQDLSLDSLRQQVILVPQEAHFWSRSIIDNFHLANANASFEEIVSACKIAEADEFINKLPEKYQTILGEFGANISGGQRQRLAIARAIVSEPAILILDESTAGLDPVSESQVLQKLFNYRRGKTTILISHRPRVISYADYIVYLENGRVKNHGTQEYLKTQRGGHLDFLI
ncbi:peptidase domain-containing ABC transporter [Calothrix sp. 336/3]|uniref:peptidase domain-containing ABC transporter n=1 Tax=Calothrix sp. 336/3 TaxID=1337936 RepID=UPI0004E34EA6|nr:peptidase domain-containing ABC transporter [Calothrix sp. 336/3]AKG22062.1 ABC transporter ATP-binding protein [Calothrix sp. 336/3]